MKALVLSGGSGTRLRPITHTSAEQLVPVADKPVLFYGLEAIADAGITEVGIAVGETAGEIREAVGDGSRFGPDVTYVPQAEQLGPAHAVLIAREFLGEDDFVMYLGDDFAVGGITPLMDRFRAERPDAQVLLTKVPDPRQFGVAELDAEGRLVGPGEKPGTPRSGLALVGVHLFTPAVHRAVRAVRPSRRGEPEITHAVQWLIGQGRDVRATTVSGCWKDTGDVTDTLGSTGRCWAPRNRSGRARPTRTARSSAGSASRRASGSCAAGSSARRSPAPGSSSRTPTSARSPRSPRAAGFADSETEHSVVLRDSSVTGVRRVEASLIGRDVEVTPAPRGPSAPRFVPGDHSRVRISP